MLVLGVPAVFFTFVFMFVRKKKNKSGVISVQVIDKSSGKYKVVKTIGSSSNPNIIKALVLKGKQWIKSHTQQLELAFNQSIDNDVIFSSIKQVRSTGLIYLLSSIYN